MTDPDAPRLPHVLVCGTDHVAMAVSLARAGCDVTLWEPDPHDRRRLSDMLARDSALAALSVVGVLDTASAPDVVLTSGPVPAAAKGSMPVLSLDWSRANGSAFHLSALPGRQALVELIGADPGGRAASLGAALGARVVALPEGTVPPSERLMAVLSAEIEALALTGATPEEVDEALAAAGFAPGPFELQDLAGIDTCLAARRAVFARHPGPPELPLFARAVSEGRLGRKVGVGWYRYPGGGGKVEDPLIEDMAVEEARFAGLPRAELAAQDIRVRVIGMLRAEAARIVAEGGLSPAEVDEVAQLSVGAPPGVMR